MELEIAITGPIQVNTYILKDEESKEAILIDVGGSFENIKKKLDEQDYNIKYILNTHGHFDHILGEVEIQKNHPAIPIYMHEGDSCFALSIQKDMEFFGINYQTDSLKLNSFIDEKSELYIGKHKIQIFHTPGHSNGSLSFYVDGMLFSGDALFFRSIGRTDLLHGDYDTLVDSIKTKLFTLPDNTKVFPGHGPDTTIQNEKKYNPYLN